MHCRLSTFLNVNDIIYPLQFGFLQNSSASFALINLAEAIKEALDQGKLWLLICKRVFTLLTIKHCGIRGVAYSWFESHRKQYVSVNGYNSKHFPSPLGVPQSSVLGPLLFLTHINDSNTDIKQCKVQHLADETNLLHISDSIEK